MLKRLRRQSVQGSFSDLYHRQRALRFLGAQLITAFNAINKWVTTGTRRRKPIFLWH